MSIVGEGCDVHIEYEIPKHIKELITDDFLKEFRNQLFRINKYDLSLFAEEGIPMNPSTTGWYASFGKACLLTKKEELLDYYRTLTWYDSDIFDSELAEMLVERKFILGYLSKVIEEQLGIKEEDLRICDDCGGWFTKDMVVEIYDEEDYGFNYCRCFYCQDLKETKDAGGSASDYYRSVLNEIEEYVALKEDSME